MKPKFLLPHALKRIGWSLIITTIAFYITISNSHVQSYIYQLLDAHKDKFVLLINFLDDFVDEIISVLLITGLNLVAFSKEKIEDEWVSKIRLQSLQWGVYINSAILILSIILFYNLDFLQVMVYNMFTVLIFFIIRFNYILYIKPLAHGFLNTKNNSNAF